MKRAVFDPLGMTKTSMGLGSDFVLEKTARRRPRPPLRKLPGPDGEGLGLEQPLLAQTGRAVGRSARERAGRRGFMDSFLHPEGKASR
ncbi:MAG: hypothetical protein R2724_07170 [Bryobacterales bacterium]